MNEDTRLLELYVSDSSEAAFAELVRLRIDLVYSAALRQTAGDHHTAQEITQMVFIALARKARRLLGHPALSAWLYRVTCYESANLLRKASRRTRHERAAAEEFAVLAGPQTNWEGMQPVLDLAMRSLPERDRAALVLRYFERAALRELGERLGLSENATRMRVQRALERLRAELSRRGVTSSAGALGLLLSEQAIMAAPVGAAAGVAATALGATAASSVASAAAFMTTLKISSGLGLAALATGGLFFWQQQRAEQAATAQVAAVRSRLRDLSELRMERDRQDRQLRDVRDLQTATDAEAALERELAAATRTADEATRRHAGQRRAELAANAASDASLPSEPVPRKQVRPLYPPELRAAKLGGTVVVDVTVDNAGRVQDARATNSTDTRFEAAAVAAIGQWEFKPGAERGTPVNAHFQIPIVFSIGASTGSPRDWFPITHAP